jgi:hypothetical protein
MTKTNTDNKTEERRNRFNGESIMLTKQEASKHDAIFMCELMAPLEDKTLGEGASIGTQCVSTWIGFVRTMLRHTWSY